MQSLMFFIRAEVKFGSCKNYDSQFDAQLSNLNSLKGSAAMSDEMEAIFLLGNVIVDCAQQSFVIAAASPSQQCFLHAYHSIAARIFSTNIFDIFIEIIIFIFERTKLAK